VKFIILFLILVQYNGEPPYMWELKPSARDTCMPSETATVCCHRAIDGIYDCEVIPFDKDVKHET
jgi:hypothetical protein